MLPIGGCRAYDTGSNSSILPSNRGKMFGMSVRVMGGWAKGRCTGRYDNICFNMKTTYCNTYLGCLTT